MCGGPFTSRLRDGYTDDDGRVYVDVSDAITGCDSSRVYSCPVADTRSQWLANVLACHRVENIPRLLDEHMPSKPTAAFIQALDYTRAQVAVLHQAQRDRLNKE